MTENRELPSAQLKANVAETYRRAVDGKEAGDGVEAVSQLAEILAHKKGALDVLKKYITGKEIREYYKVGK